MFKDQNFSLKDFQAWLSNYNQNKANQQDFGVKNIPARIFRKTIDLSKSGLLQNTGIPFDGLQVEKIYVTASGASADGSINIIFDRAMSDSQFNYKTLKENDSFTSGTSISKAFFSWAAQAGMSADIVFFNDIDYKSGSQKTSVVGTITTTPSNIAATSIKQVPSLVTRLAAYNTSPSYVVPAGFYAEIDWSYASSATGGGGANAFTVGGTPIFTSFGAVGTTASGQTTAVAGETISMVSTSIQTWFGCQIRNYPI